jgi:hypothetical protein
MCNFLFHLVENHLIALIISNWIFFPSLLLRYALLASAALHTHTFDGKKDESLDKYFSLSLFASLMYIGWWEIWQKEKKTPVECNECLMTKILAGFSNLFVWICLDFLFFLSQCCLNIGDLVLAQWLGNCAMRSDFKALICYWHWCHPFAATRNLPPTFYLTVCSFSHASHWKKKHHKPGCRWADEIVFVDLHFKFRLERENFRAGIYTEIGSRKLSLLTLSIVSRWLKNLRYTDRKIAINSSAGNQYMI